MRFHNFAARSFHRPWTYVTVRAAVLCAIFLISISSAGRAAIARDFDPSNAPPLQLSQTSPPHRFDEEAAKDLIQSHGFTTVSGLTQDADGNWTALVEIYGDWYHVSLDPRGNLDQRRKREGQQ